MADLEKIAEDLSSLTVLEAADLAKILEEKQKKEREELFLINNFLLYLFYKKTKK